MNCRLIFLACLFAFVLMDYGGVRSPDSEIVFRVAESLATGKGFTVAQPLAKSPTFGIFRGVDGRLYSYFPPLESVMLAPLVRIGKWINKTGWYRNFPLPVSHFVDLQPLLVRIDGKIKQRWDPPSQNLEEHALRFLASGFNPLISSLTVALFWLLMIRMRLSKVAATAVSLFYAFGTLVWPYSGTYFSEPLTTLLVLFSFYLLIKSDSDFSEDQLHPLQFFFSGLFLGTATLNHYTATLFLPFFFIYALRCCRQKYRTSAILWWLVGTVPPLLFLLYFNYIRFGDFLEFGRRFQDLTPVVFYFPGSSGFRHAFLGLTFGSGKGLFLYCPAVILGVLAWPHFHKRARFLSFLTGAMILFRIVFLSCFYGWHGGFCLGPRFLIPVLPFFLIPAAFWFSDKRLHLTERKLWALGFFVWLCVVQQIYFCIGEIFSYYHLVKFLYRDYGMNAFQSDFMYTSWYVSPLYRLIQYRRGPFLLQAIPLSNQMLWLFGSIAAGIFVFMAARMVQKRNQKELLLL